MINDSVRYVFSFVGLVLLQVLLLNNIQFLGFINPFFYLYFILCLPSSVSKDMLLFLGFILGFTVDIFSGTLGCHTFATVLLAYLKPYCQRIFGPREYNEIVVPSWRSFGTLMYFQYVFYLVFIHQIVFFFVEAFTFAHFWSTLLKAVCCCLFTVFFILCIEYIKQRK